MYMTEISRVSPYKQNWKTVEFGKYLKIVLIEDCDKVSQQPVKDAFHVLMTQRHSKVWPKFHNFDRPNRRFELHNAIIRWLQDRNLGWQKQ